MKLTEMTDNTITEDSCWTATAAENDQQTDDTTSSHQN